MLIVISRLFVVIKLACLKVIWLSGAYCSIKILIYLIVFNYLCWIFFLVMVCSRVCLTSRRLNNKMYFLIEYCHEAELAKKCWKRKKNKKKCEWIVTISLRLIRQRLFTSWNKKRFSLLWKCSSSSFLLFRRLFLFFHFLEFKKWIF